MANSVDPDQTAPLGLYTVCQDLSLRKLRNITLCNNFVVKLILPESNKQQIVYTISKTAGSFINEPRQANLCLRAFRHDKF